MKFFYMILFTNLYMILNFTSPVTLLISILSQVLMICFLLWMSSNSSWFAFILFIIYLGGLMVLFVYIVSLASNEKIFLKMNFKHFLFFSILSFIFILLLSKNILNTNNLKFNFSMNFYFMFSLNSMKLIIFSMFYLLFTLITVIKICNKFSGPLKSY